MTTHTNSHILKRVVFILIITLQANTYAYWVDHSNPLEDLLIVPKLCSEMMVANHGPLIIDTNRCISQGTFNITSKYLAQDKGLLVTTLVKLNVHVGSLSCSAKIKKTYDHKFVNHQGEIQVKKAGWKVIYVNDCVGVYNSEVFNAQIGGKNVVPLKHADFLKLPEQTKKNLRYTNLLTELGEEDYRYLETRYYKVLDIAYKLIGILEHSRLQQINDNSTDWFLIRYNAAGNRLGEIE